MPIVPLILACVVDCVVQCTADPQQRQLDHDVHHDQDDHNHE
jgi:hypothetical protein